MKSSSDRSAREAARIERAYQRRAESGCDSLYDVNRPEVRIQIEQCEQAIRDIAEDAMHGSLAGLRVLDVGCGHGWLIRSMIGLGVSPQNVAGTELIADRIAHARSITLEGPLWHLGSLDSLATVERFDIVAAFTVFSSILDGGIRQDLAREMWRRVAPGGYVVVYDFRYDNPSNRDVRKVPRREMRVLFPEGYHKFRSMTLAPPISRLLAPRAPSIARALEHVPLLRSHLLFTARKPA